MCVSGLRGASNRPVISMIKSAKITKIIESGAKTLETTSQKQLPSLKTDDDAF